MTEGEPQDETGESATEGRSREEDGPSEAAVDGSASDDEPADDAPATDEDSDPAAEVEAAVEEAIGPHVLEDGEDADAGEPAAPTDQGETDATPAGTDGATRATDGESAAEDGDGSVAEDGAESTDGVGDSSTATADGASATEAGDDSAAEGSNDSAAEVGDESVAEVGDELADEAPSDDESTGETPAGAEAAGGDLDRPAEGEPAPDVPPDVRKYDRFKKIDGGTYDRANEFLRERTYITAREWAMARLCADFRTETGVEMTKIGENLPELVPFMTDTYTPQAVNQARAAFEEKVRKAGATFLYGAMCDFFTAEELDDVMYEATEVAKFLLEVEGVELSVEEELAAEDHISEVMRDVREHSAALRHDELTCPECGHEFDASEDA